VTEAPEIEFAQAYDHYSAEEHETWRRLYARMLPKWHRYANPKFLQGIQALSLDPLRVPRLEDVNRFLLPLTGFRAKAVGGYVPAFTFFDCLANREFPTTVTVRGSNCLDYLPEPDIFHDIAGHVPMHTDSHFAETLVRFGECARKAAKLNAPPAQLAAIIRAMARFFWFTIEFGLMRAAAGSGPGLKVYGSGLLSSYGEIEHAIESPAVQRYPLQLEWVVNQSFEIDRYQPLLFVADSFEHLYGLVGELERWMLAGKLDNVAPGPPLVKEEDLLSFRFITSPVH
jgi:phenylalanine-4-hydroxylase